MIHAEQFAQPLDAAAHTFVSGVPCSYLRPLINRIINSPKFDYVGAASEGEAIGICLGAYLAGRKTVSLCQNSGLGNMVNPLTSLNFPFKIPNLLIVTQRGEPGRPDEPQHELMGSITHRLLETIGIEHLPFPDEIDEIEATLAKAVRIMNDTKQPVALIMRKGSVGPEKLNRQQPASRIKTNWLQSLENSEVSTPPSRFEAIESILKLSPESAAIIATTGKTGRELYTAADREQHLYVVGGMGTASGIALGVALNAKDRPIVVIDGDGAALMKLGTFATIGAQAPTNLIHILLDNEVHDSTGAQATVANTTRFAGIAAAANYRNVAEVHNLADFENCLQQLYPLQGPSLLHLKIRPGSIDPLGRPKITPEAVKERFMAFLKKPCRA